MTVRHGSSAQRHASQHLDWYGLRQVESDTDKHQTASCQSASNLCDRADPDYITAACRKTSLDELPVSEKIGRIRPIHPGEGLRTQL